MKKNGDDLGKDIEVLGDKNAFLLKVSVKTNGKRNDIFRNKEGDLIIETTAPPMKGKANSKINKILKKKIGGSISIVKGQKSHNKWIRIDDLKIDIVELEELIKK